jgi:hypothetical protein
MRITSLVLILIVAAVAPAAAQPLATAPHAYVGAGILADDDATWANVRVVPALAIAAGVDLGPTIGIRLSVDSPAAVVESRQSVANGRSYATMNSHRSITWSGLVDVHRPLGDHARIGFLTGVSWAVRPDVYETIVDSAATPGGPARHDEYRTAYTFTWLGVTAGVEAPIAIGSRASIVPDIRVVYFPLAEYGDTTILRSGVSLRWRF